MSPRAILPAFALACVLSACATVAPAPPAPLPALTGTWELARVDGAPLPAPSPTEDGVTILSGGLELGPAGEFTLHVVAHVRGGADRDARSLSGSYVVSDGAMLVTTVHEGAEPLRFGLVHSPDSLRLEAFPGNHFSFVRR
jgi:hypothetical protein